MASAQEPEPTTRPPQISYFAHCPDTDAYVDRWNASWEGPNAKEALEANIDASSQLAAALKHCADRITDRAASENYVQGYNDLYYVAWLQYRAATFYVMVINDVWYAARAQRANLTRQDKNVILSTARMALSLTHLAKSQPLQESVENQNFLRGVGDLEVMIHDLAEKYIPDRAADMY